MRSEWIRVVLVSGLSLTCQVAWSQSLPTIAASDSSAAADGSEPESSKVVPAQIGSSTRGIEEIIVTAQKREENLQDVPISIQAFSSEKLDTAGIASAADLPRVVPGMVLTQTIGFASTFIRGLGTDAFIFADSSVAFYVDGIYNPNPLATAQDFGSIERVEVVKGPQGTLFGRNAIGGAVNIITAPPPLDEASSSIFVSYRRFDDSRVRANVGIPLAEEFGISVSGFYNNSDNYLDGRIDDRDLPRNIDKGARIKARYRPVDDLEVTLAASKAISQGLRSTYAVNTDPSPLASALLVMPQDSYGGQLNDATDAGFDETIYSATVMANFDWFDVKLLGNTQDSKGKQSFDFDGSPMPVAYFDVNLITDAQTAELQILSNESSWASDHLTWILGGYYFKGHAGYKNGFLRVAETQLSGQATLLNIPLPDSLQTVISLLSGLPVPSGTVGIAGLLDTESYSGYAQATYNVTEVIALTLGGRYQVERREINKSTASILNLNRTEVLVPGQNFSCDTDSQWCATSRAFSPKVGVDYRLGDETLLYASWQKATKSGTFNVINIYDQPDFVKPEGISAYEAGVKAKLADGSIIFNAAAFYYDLNNLQTQFISLLAGGAISVENAPAAEVKGAEVDVTVEVLPEWIDDLILGVNGTYLDAQYTDFENGSGFGEQSGIFSRGNDYTGNDITRSPTFSGTASLSKSFVVPIGEIEVAADYYYNSGYYFMAQNQKQDEQKSYGLLGSRISLDIENWNVRITLFGENITNEKYYLSRLPTDFGTTDTRAPKSTYGVKLGWDF